MTGTQQTTPPGISVRRLEHGGDLAYRSETPDHAGSLVIERRWQDVSGATLAAHAFHGGAWWVLMVVLFVEIVSGEYFEGPFWITFALLLWLVFSILPLAISWNIASTTLNTTKITLDATTIVVRHGPIPALRDRVLSRQAVRRLYTKTFAAPSPKVETLFTLVAQLRSGEEVEILNRIRAPEPCLFIEAQITAYLEELNARQQFGTGVR